jgi:hypothetical protein
MFDLGERYKTHQKEGFNGKIIYLKRYHERLDTFFILATIEPDINKIEIRVGDEHYIIKSQPSEDLIKMIIELYEDWEKAKLEFEKVTNKLKSLSKGDKSLLRNFKLNNLGI